MMAAFGAWAKGFLSEFLLAFLERLAKIPEYAPAEEAASTPELTESAHRVRIAIKKSRLWQLVKDEEQQTGS